MNRRDFLALSSVALTGCGGGIFGWSDVSIPLPAVLRTDLQYGYYFSLAGQMAETKDHTSVYFWPQWTSIETLASELAQGSQDVMMDCAPQLTRPTGKDSRKALAPDAEVALRTRFTELRSAGLLHRVRYLTPFDEPNLFADSEADLLGALVILKRVAAEFQELSGVKYFCIYGSKAENLYGLDQFDIVGIDNYEQLSEVLTKGAHADLMKRIHLHQQVMVIPGAAYYQDPAPFVAYAHSEPRCWGVLPFIWAHIPESADKEGWKGLSVQGPAEQERYRQAGLLTLNRRST